MEGCWKEALAGSGNVTSGCGMECRDLANRSRARLQDGDRVRSTCCPFQQDTALHTSLAKSLAVSSLAVSVRVIDAKTPSPFPMPAPRCLFAWDFVLSFGTKSVAFSDLRLSLSLDSEDLAQREGPPDAVTKSS